MFIVWAYFFYLEWGYFGWRVRIEVVLEHWAPSIIDSLNRYTGKPRPEQKASTYG